MASFYSSHAINQSLHKRLPYDSVRDFAPVSLVVLSPGMLVVNNAGKLRALAVTSRTRTGAAPDVPTMIEAGVSDYDASSWYGLLAPAGTPRAIVMRLSSETAQIMKMNDVRERLIPQGLDPVGGTPAEFAATINDERVKWSRVIKAAGLKPE